MKRILALLLTVIMMFGTLAIDLSAASAVPDVFELDDNNKPIPGEIDWEATIKQYLTLPFESEKDKLATMEMMYEKDGYQLWVDDYTGEVATVNLATGQILLSNPYDIGIETDIKKGTSENIRSELFSQIIIKYTDNDTDKTMNSFSEAASRGQVNFEYIKNGIRVEYSIGREEARMLVPRVIEKNRFEENILQPFADEVNKISEENGYNILNWRDYLPMAKRNNMIKDSSPTGNPKDGNNEWFKFVKLLAFYSEKSLAKAETDKERRSMEALYPICKKMDIWVCTPDISRNELITVEGYIKTYIPAYTFEQLEYDHQLTEYIGQDKSPPLFKMALEYTLDEKGMSVRLPANGLRFDESLYQLTYVSILPYMGAGANYHLKDSEDLYTGYNLFPDGSGTLFRHEDLVQKSQTVINGKVYGQDFAYNTITGSNQQVIRYPVFGIVSNTHRTEEVKVEQLATEEVIDNNGNVIIVDKDGSIVEEHKYEEVIEEVLVEEDKGFVAIIEEGDALAELSDYHMGSSAKYNTVQMLFYPRPKDSYNLANAISVGANASWTVVSSRKYVGNYKIRYIMLTDDQIAEEKGITDYYECTWMGMAEAYRDYLYDKGELDALTADEVQEDIPMYIETFGTLETLEKIMSIPVNVMTSLTSFENVKTMYDELSAEGVNNIKFKLTGYANGGMYSSVPYKLEWEKSVGGDKGYEDLLDYSAEKGFEVFPEFDFAYSQGDRFFDGLRLKKHIVKSINDTYMSRRYYSATRQTHVGRFELAISSAYFTHFYDKLTSNLLKNYEDTEALAGISVSTLGTDLNSDFDEDEPYNRDDAKKHTQALFSKMDEDYDLVMTDGANAYTWKYVDYILNMPLDSSRYNNSANAVPFIGVVLHGSVEFAGTPLNMEGNIGYSMLKAIENGAGLYFVLCYENYEELKEDYNLQKYYSVRYDILKDDVIKYYTILNDLTKELQLNKIVGHQFLIGERIPDADEVLADEEALKKEEALAEELAAEEARKELQQALLEGRVYAATVSKTASDEINKLYNDISGYYNGAININEKGIVSVRIGMNTLVKDALKYADLKAPLEDPYALANAWNRANNAYASLVHIGSNKLRADFIAADQKAQTSLTTAINAIAEKEAALELAMENAISAKVTAIPTLVYAYETAVAARDAITDTTSADYSVKQIAVDNALANLTGFVASLDDARAYADAISAKETAEKAISQYLTNLNGLAKMAEGDYTKAQADLKAKLAGNADFDAKAKAVEDKKFSLSTLEIVLSGLERALTTYAISYPDSTELNLITTYIADYKQKIIDAKADIKVAQDALDALYIAADANFADLKAKAEAAAAAVENYMSAAEIADQVAAVAASEKNIESLRTAIEASVKAAYEKLAADYMALADAEAEKAEKIAAMEKTYFSSSEYTKLVAEVNAKKLALQQVLDGYLEDATYKDWYEKLAAPTDAKLAELTAQINGADAKTQIKLATEILNILNATYQKVKVPTILEGVETNVLLEVEKGNDGLVKGAGFILNDFITKWQKTCKTSDEYKAAEAALKTAETAVNNYKNAKSGKLGSEYTALSQAKNDLTKQRGQFLIDNNDLKNALAQLVAAESGVITAQAAADEAAANLAGAKAFEGVDSYAKVVEAFNAAMASNPNILTEYQAALKNYNTAFDYVKSQITSVNTLFKSFNTQVDTLNRALKNSDIAKDYYNSAEFKGVYSAQFLGALENVYNETVKNTKEGNAIVDLAFAKFIETLELAKAVIPNTSTDLKLNALRVEVKADGSLVITEPEIVEEETEEETEEEIPEYEYTKYTDDSGSIVYLEFDNGTFFLLNYNDYSVTVEFNGTTYTLETYGGIKVVSGQEPESFSFAKIN